MFLFLGGGALLLFIFDIISRLADMVVCYAGEAFAELPGGCCWGGVLLNLFATKDIRAGRAGEREKHHACHLLESRRGKCKTVRVVLGRHVGT